MDEWHNSFLRIAQEIAKHSTCIRKSVGGILTKDTRIISTGYNGVPSKKIHCKEIFKNYKNNLQNPKFLNLHKQWSEKYELHAEQNCLMYAARNGISTINSTLYITLSPCLYCCKLIISSGIKEVFYLEEYDRENMGIKFLIKNNIYVEKIILGE